MKTFFDRFLAATVPEPITSLQVIYPSRWTADRATIELVLRDYHPELAEALLEWEPAPPEPATQRQFIPGAGPPACGLGLVSWGSHILKCLAFDAPMPYGPIQSCVLPAMMAPEIKADAQRHLSHLLLVHAGPERDPREMLLALSLAAGAFSTLGATAILHEDARTAIPALDLWPEPGEDIRQTLLAQPLLYLFAGFVRTSVGGPDRPWMRTFNCHRFHLPDLAMQTEGYDAGGQVFRQFQAILNYLRTTNAGFFPGQILCLDEATNLRIREPHDHEADFLANEGPLFVLERTE